MTRFSSLPPSQAQRAPKEVMLEEIEALQSRNACWQAIGAVASQLNKGMSARTIFNEAVRECARALAMDLVCVFLMDEETGRLDAAASVGLDLEMLPAMTVPPGGSVVETARKSLPAWACPGLQGRMGDADPLESALFLPLMFRDLTFGVLCVARKDRVARFSHDEMHLLLSLANQLGLAAFLDGPAQGMMQQERMERDLYFSHALLAELVPDRAPAHWTGYRLDLHMARSLETSGDFVDFFDLPGERHALVVGETSGLGIRSALNLAHLMPLIRGRLASAADLESLGHALNAAIIDHGKRGQLVSLAVAVLDRAAREVALVRVGSTGAYLVDDAGVRNLADCDGTPLGILTDYEARVRTLPLAPGSTLLFTTDGLNKCRDAEGVWFEPDRLRYVIGQCAAADPRPAVPPATCLAEKVTSHLPGGLPEDDFVIVSLECLP